MAPDISSVQWHCETLKEQTIKSLHKSRHAHLYFPRSSVMASGKDKIKIICLFKNTCDQCCLQERFEEQCRRVKWHQPRCPLQWRYYEQSTISSLSFPVKRSLQILCKDSWHHPQRGLEFKKLQLLVQSVLLSSHPYEINALALSTVHSVKVSNICPNWCYDRCCIPVADDVSTPFRYIVLLLGGGEITKNKAIPMCYSVLCRCSTDYHILTHVSIHD